MSLSCVVQGPILPFTKDCCVSLRTHFPNVEIILSTWKGSIVDDLSFDQLILSEDKEWDSQNISRQITTTLEGIKAAKHDLVMKVRSDAIFSGAGCLAHLTRWTKRDNRFKIFNNRLIVPNMQTVDPENKVPDPTWHRCFNVSDWVILGNKDDLIVLFDLPLTTGSNLSPEQYIWVNAINKRSIIQLDHMLHMNHELIDKTFKFFANNLVVLDTYSQFEFKSGRYAWQKEDFPHLLRHAKWLKYYQEIEDFNG